MGYYLEFGPQVKMKNPLNGQFNKGHATWNKGMTWDEMGISPEKQARMRANLSLHRKGRAIGGWNRKAIVAMDDDGHILAWFSSACDAEGKAGRFDSAPSHKPERGCDKDSFVRKLLFTLTPCLP